MQPSQDDFYDDERNKIHGSIIDANGRLIQMESSFNSQSYDSIVNESGLGFRSPHLLKQLTRIVEMTEEESAMNSRILKNVDISARNYGNLSIIKDNI